MEYGKFIVAFNDWRKEQELTISAQAGFQYLWRLGTEAVKVWEPEFEENMPDATEEEIEMFKNTLKEGGILVGIPIGPMLEGFDGAKLYKMTKHNQSFSIPNVVFSYMVNIFSGGRIVTTDGEQVIVPIAITPGSIQFTNSFDGIDTIFDRQRGSIVGKGFSYNQRGTNKQNGESVSGFVNYVNGNIELFRSSTYNEDLVINKYEPFCISGGGSSSGGSSSSPELLPSLNRMNITGTFETYGDPTECVFTYIME
jgi:hypothetical protein